MPSRRIAVTVAALVLAAPALHHSTAVGRSVQPAAPRSFTVTASLSSTEVLLDERTVLSGKVKPVRDTKALVERLGDDGWTTVARRNLDDAGGYRYAFRPQQPGEHIYRVKVLRLGKVRAGTSPKVTLTVAEQALVVFRIPAGTGAGDWNTAETTVRARVGDTLRVVNGDSVPHRLHTDGAPFPHPQGDIPAGGSEDLLLESPHDSGPEPPLYCHTHGSTSEFWLDVVD